MADANLLNFNVGVLGHVDSGKTTLSKSLSTVASTAAFDKNPQSKERGITLDLGFSSFCADAPEHLRVENETESVKSCYEKIQYTLVDCPGHASLIKAIIGGAQIIDLMLLVVDIIKGFQTQTAECLIIGQITCNKMIVVLNKIDLISNEKRSATIEKMKKKVAKTLENTRFAGCPIVPVAASPGGAEGDGAPPLGVDDLVDTLLSQTYVPQRDATGPFVFSVDHCFSIRGQGTVMTGTVLSGQTGLNRNIEIPALKVVKKVKSMQRFKIPVDSAKQGDRVGICVTQFDPKLLERGLVCEPGALPTVHAAVVSIEKIAYFKGSVKSKCKYHVTIGHETVMSKLTVFCRDIGKTLSKDEGCNGGKETFDFSRDYEYTDELLAGGEHRDNSQTTVSHERRYYALLELEKSVTCPQDSLVIGSKLDADIHSNACRIAFHGRLLETMSTPDYAKTVLPSLKVFKTKRKEGTVERVQDERTVIVRDLFKKESNVEAFVGLKVELTSGERGRIEGTFGKSGKITINIPDGVLASTKKQYSTSGKKRVQTKQNTDDDNDEANNLTSEPIRVLLSFKRYIFDQSKKMVQTNS